MNSENHNIMYESPYRGAPIPDDVLNDYIQRSGLASFLEEEEETEIIYEPSFADESVYFADPAPLAPNKGRQPDAAYEEYFSDTPAFAKEFKPEPSRHNADTLAELDVFCNGIQALVAPSYAVGGCVRDALLGIPCHDYDFTTPVKPNYLSTYLKRSGYRLRPEGMNYGTFGFKKDGKYVEITTFRSDTYSPGNRYPQVEFVDRLETDLSRRDFTINAMAFIGGNLIDPFDGYHDLKSRTIRTIGKAQMRFEEDPLRILRAVRFVSQLDFHLDAEAQQAIRQTWPKLTTISRRRWGVEISRLLAGKNPVSALNILRKTGALEMLLPEISHINDRVWDLAMKAIDSTSGTMETPCDKLVYCEKGPSCLKGAADRTVRELYTADKRLAILLSCTSSRPEVLREVEKRLCLNFDWDEARFAHLKSLTDGLLSEQSSGSQNDSLTSLENVC